jgi:hypothetical protein
MLSVIFLHGKAHYELNSFAVYFQKHHHLDSPITIGLSSDPITNCVITHNSMIAIEWNEWRFSIVWAPQKKVHFSSVKTSIA